MNQIVDRLLALANQPYLKAAFVLAQAAKTFIQGNSVQVAVRIVADSKMKSVEKAMEELERKKDVRSAAEGILTQLIEAYYLFESYYNDMPKRMKVRIPGLWEFNELHAYMRGTAEIEDTIARICFLKAVYHKALGDDFELVKEWLCTKKFPCDNYKILAGLLGQDAAIEYLAANPVFGNRIANEYLAEKNVSLEDYCAKSIRSDSFDGISFGEEDPIIYLD